MALSPGDPNSYSRPDLVKTTHVHLELEVDFDKKILVGRVVLSLEKVNPQAETVILDVRDLNVSKISDESSGDSLEFTYGSPTGFGEKLEIKLPKSEQKELKISVEYSSSPGATALQWLSPAQTAGKTQPYVFSQCQAIHARSMLPCQDTPSVKTPYTATITAPAQLTALMSAIRDGEDQVQGDKKISKFIQKVPIQSYLIAIAVGAVESRKIGPRTHVWSEKEFVEKAAFDFSETESFIETAEELCGPYVWGNYDILVLPPSFAYGGMENPCMTFATPTLLTGDKSNADVIAHEIAHSWTGNLVTNFNFEHFWLNEGFTVFTERYNESLSALSRTGFCFQENSGETSRRASKTLLGHPPLEGLAGDDQQRVRSQQPLHLAGPQAGRGGPRRRLLDRSVREGLHLPLVPGGHSRWCGKV